MRLASIPDAQFLQLLEQKDMPASFFNHAGHIRAAWLYVQQYPLTQAIERCCDSIQGFAESLGAADKYHTSVTVAMVSLVALYQIPGSRYQDWQTLVSSNEPIMRDAQQLLLRFYSPQLLSSCQAKQGFVAPDLRPFALSQQSAG